MAKKKVIIICHGQVSAITYGNITTVSRIASNLETRSYSCTLIKPDDILQGSDWWKVHTESVGNCVLAINAWHCASVLSSCPLKYAIIFGGTDLNFYSNNNESLKIMTDVVCKAEKLITFSSSMTNKVIELWPHYDLSVKTKEIPQAVKTSPCPYDIQDFLKNDRGINADNIFLLVAGIRPVKDPLFLIADFQEWHKKHLSCWLVIVGCKRDPVYYQKVENAIKDREGVILLPEMPQCHVYACICSSVALVNSSLSEGMCSAILESMDLETPVIARNISGNRDLIEHGKSGFLFDTPTEFLRVAELVLENEELCREVVRIAKEKIVKSHQCEQEANAYDEMLKELLAE